jgi:hypothetical protein
VSKTWRTFTYDSHQQPPADSQISRTKEINYCNVGNIQEAAFQKNSRIFHAKVRVPSFVLSPAIVGKHFGIQWI